MLTVRKWKNILPVPADNLLRGYGEASKERVVVGLHRHADEDIPGEAVRSVYFSC